MSAPAGRMETALAARELTPPERDGTGIVTPEAVLLDLDTAGYATRVLAGLLDLAIQLALVVVVSLVATWAFLSDGSGVRTVVAVATFVALFGYPITLETWLRGRTVGKMALGIRAVTSEGAPLRLRDATLRAMGGVVDRLFPPGGITGALFVLLTPRHQRVGDLIAGTIVVRDPARGGVAPALWFSPPTGLEAYAESIDPTAITVEQYTVVRSFLTRASSLPTPVRDSIADDLADRVAARVRHDPPPWLPAEDFLICVMARSQRRSGPGRPRPCPVPRCPTPSRRERREGSDPVASRASRGV